MHQPVVNDLRPRLHSEVEDAHLVERQHLACELVGFADRDVVGIALDEKHDAEVHARNRRGVVVEQAEQRGVEAAFVHDLLLPLALQPIRDRVPAAEIARVDVAADAQRVLLAQPSLGRRPQPVGEEVLVAVVEHDVRDDLLVGRVILDLGARLEEMPLADHLLVALQSRGHEAVPRAVGKDVVATHAQHRFHCARSCRHAMRTSPRPNTATSSAVRSMSSSVTGRK